MRAAVGILAISLATALAPFAAQAATVSIDPASGSYGVGDTFIATIRIDTQGKCINAAQVTIAYPPDDLRAIDFSEGNSVFSLWVQNPTIDQADGQITFAGGIPGGYCGEIPGDSEQSDVLGQVIFTVLKDGVQDAPVTILPSSVAYLNDGLGTKAPLSVVPAAYALVATTTQESNPWVQELLDDTTPPDPFTIQIESTEGVFGGAYYAVFSTVDKQSGVDHYEAYVDGAWIRVTSPYRLPDQFLAAPVQIRAVDKAGNVRLGTYNASSTPPLHAGSGLASLAVVLFLLIAGVLFLFGLWVRAKWHPDFGSTPPQP